MNTSSQSGRPLASTDSDDSRPSYTCEGCWKGVVAHQLGLLQPPVEQHESDPGPSAEGYVYKVSEEEIKRGAEQGCRWCELLSKWGASSIRSPSTQPVPPSENIVEIRVGYAEGCVDITINGHLSWFGYVYTTEDDPAAAYVPGRNLFCEVGSERALSLAMELLHDCNLNHSGCPREPYSVLPTRVIDCSDPSRPRLLTADGVRARYVALSYVWGEAQEHKTTTENIDAYLRSIDVTILPQTIVDAIQVTHRLGLQYLWIDSLCIIQDSEDDKNHELAHMRHVYADAYLTIIAASASRVSAGFLEPRTDTLGTAALQLPFVVPSRDADLASPSEAPSYGAVFLSSWLITTPKYDPAREPLHKRGWCMQEYFLSPRKLIFASHTLQYGCFHGGTRNIAHADNPWWVSSARDPTPFRRLPKLPPSPSPTEPAPAREHVEALREAWKATVENYTKRAVSVPSDKLVALSSLAEEFSHAVQSPYVAGLWARTLLPDLLWSKERAAHFASRPREYRAPSWSWAAVDGPVNPGNAYFLSEHEKVIAEVVKCKTVLKNPGLPFGEVTGGTLVLRARVVVDCVVLPHWAVYRRKDGGHADESSMSRSEGSTSTVQRMSLVDERMHEIGLCRLDSDNDGIRSGVKHVSVVPVYSRWESTPGIATRERVVQGLVVARVDAASSQPVREARYRRIGMFEGSDNVNDWLESTPEIEIEIV
ncbi:heterokaryon incompatibility protein-domain-containing protein [Dichomitus squalens]|uniref:Heterokaryon incompatibility protein-domain-containing protein n=1 Tax=Dichomitus squalens TaxID=114155 RepID=A0A4Q9NKF8_9APHY|nr:heterokaryon incompatibility protein-domain-containing protein [Dichomitus squalens]TBU55700.1 heterokaryon incompatibility protein-domain-containing protein [Dichomitus squalens]